VAGSADYVRLDSDAMTLVFALTLGGSADLIYLGARLPKHEDLAALAQAFARGRHESQPDAPPVPGVLPERKGGWSGTPAIVIREAGTVLDTDFRLARWEGDGRALVLTFADPLRALEVEQRWQISAAGMVCVTGAMRHDSPRALVLDRMSALALPVPARFSEVIGFAGRWASEMHEARRAIAPHGLARRSHGGKPGFGGGNWLILEDPASGEVLGLHLAWSGDYDTRIECDSAGVGDGRALLQMAAVLGEGEVDFTSVAQHHTPTALFTLAADRSALAQRFHHHTRTEVLHARESWPPRRVHLNTWEALGFNLTEPQLLALAADAASLGVERFVLDDGWFGGRRNDQTSLGDWHVSPEVFPNGLGPLIDHVHALGMDFGLWVEPEMVSPDSDLYRAHPDWCLHLEGRERPTMRGQLALNLARPEVGDHLFAALDALLRKSRIAYLKWDHNRDLFPTAASQTQGFYALLDRLRAAHSEVEIESCSSGGGRIDLSVLARCHRVWPSDNNDAIERLRIMRAWSQFLPLEVLGSHVGPSPNPITGRQAPMDFRAKVALFGHMGVEADPGGMDAAERSVLSAHIALYKHWRAVLHAGDWWRLDHTDPGVFAQLVTHGNKALALAAQTGFSRAFDAAPVRLKGLEAGARYHVTLPRPWPERATRYLPDGLDWDSGLTLSGTALMVQGLALPLTHPETAWLIALERLDA
jgi:alpha-galactosidase